MKKTPKNAEFFECDKCAFKCSKQSDWSRHIVTAKHKNRTKLDKIEQKNAEIYSCSCCGKIYKARNSLWYHAKKCQGINSDIQSQEIVNYDSNMSNTMNTTNNMNKDDFIQYLMKENAEMKNLVLEVYQKIQPSNVTNNNIVNNSHKTFNLNVFLNEECKDAMNIMDFVDSLKIQLADLENVGKLGFVEGITNIIVKNLKALDVNKRPVHCSDTKRDVLYVKDEDKWEKENNNENQKLRKAIKYIANKNSKMLPVFAAKYPDCIYSDSKKSDQYNQLIIEAMGGEGDDEIIKENKIIKSIAKEVLIDK